MTETAIPRWRPVPRIRPIAIGLVFSGDRILAMRVLDDAGTLTGVRPPGGAINFGETAVAAVEREFKEEFGCAIDVEDAPLVLENLYEHHGAAVEREFKEEFGCAIDVEDAPLVLENLYEHHGAPGHEIVFDFRVRLLDEALYSAERIRVDEGNGNVCDVDWFDCARVRSGAVTLHLVGLAGLLA